MAERVRSTVTGGFTTACTTTHYNRGPCSDPWAYVVGDDIVTYSGVKTTKTIKDTVTPGFHSLVKCGGFLPINRVEISTVKETRTPGTGTYETSKSGGCYHDRYVFDLFGAYPHVLDVPGVNESILDSVITSAVANLKEAVLDVLTTMAELRDLVRLFQSSAGRLSALGNLVARRALSIARRNRRSRRRSGRGLLSKDPFAVFAALWLEYRYGWLPLVYTIQDALRALESSIQEGQLITGTAFQIEDLSGSNTEVETDGIDATYTTTTVITGSRRYQAKAYGRVNNVNSTKFAFDPLITGWELIPFSFVVDWFIGVGNFIQAWSPFSGVQSLGVTSSTKSDYTRYTLHSQSWGDVFNNGSFDGNRQEFEVKEYVRTPSGLPVLPTWNPSLSMVRQLDLAALLYALKRDIRRALSSLN